MKHVVVEGLQLEYRDLPAVAEQRSTLLLLHEGLGCVAMWRDFPDKLAAAPVAGGVRWLATRPARAYPGLPAPRGGGGAARTAGGTEHRAPDTDRPQRRRQHRAAICRGLSRAAAWNCGDGAT